MTTYSIGSSVSFDAKHSVNVKPIIRLSKSVSVVSKEYSSQEEELNTLVTTLDSLSPLGFVIVTNDEKADVIASSPGFSNGGLIYITDHYVAVAYAKGSDHFSAIKWGECEMKISWDQLSPNNYLSSDAAVILGCAPTSSLCIDGGMFQSFQTEFPLNGPVFDTALFVNRKPYALFGIETGTLSIAFAASSKKGMAKAFLFGKTPVAPVAKYDELHGIVATESIKTSVKNFIAKVCNGTATSVIKIYRYLRPTSLLWRFSNSFHAALRLDEDLLEEANVLCFDNTDAHTAYALPAYINKPAVYDGMYVDHVPELEEILAMYRAKLEAFRAQGYRQLYRMIVDEVNRTIELVKKSFFSFSVKGEVAASQVFDKIPYDFEAPKVMAKPVTVEKIVPIPEITLGSMNSAQLKDAAISAGDKLPGIAACLTVEEQEIDLGDGVIAKVKKPLYSQEKVDAIYAVVKQKCEERFHEVVDTLFADYSKNVPTINEGSAVFHKCGACNSCSNLEVPFMGSQEGQASSLINEALNKKGKNSIENFRMTNLRYVPLVGQYVATVCFDIKALPLETVDIVAGPNWGIQCVVDAVRQKLQGTYGTAVYAWYAGTWNDNPYGLTMRKATVNYLGTKITSNRATSKGSALGGLFSSSSARNVPVVVPAPIVTVQFDFFVADTDVDYSEGAEVISRAFLDSLENIETRAQSAALQWLIDELTRHGLMGKVGFFGVVQDCLVDISSFAEVCNFDITESLFILYKALHQISIGHGDDLNKISQSDKNAAAAQCEVMKTIFEKVGKRINYDVNTNQYTMVGTTATRELPWIMSLDKFEAIRDEEDYNLLPYYAAL